MTVFCFDVTAATDDFENWLMKRLAQLTEVQFSRNPGVILHLNRPELVRWYDPKLARIRISVTVTGFHEVQIPGEDFPRIDSRGRLLYFEWQLAISPVWCLVACESWLYGHEIITPVLEELDQHWPGTRAWLAFAKASVDEMLAETRPEIGAEPDPSAAGRPADQVDLVPAGQGQPGDAPSPYVVRDAQIYQLFAVGDETGRKLKRSELAVRYGMGVENVKRIIREQRRK